MSNRQGSVLGSRRTTTNTRKNIPNPQKNIITAQIKVQRPGQNSQNSTGDCSSLTIDDLCVDKCGFIRHLESCKADIECLDANRAKIDCLEVNKGKFCELCVTGDVHVCRDLFVKGDGIFDGKILAANLEVSGEVTANIFRALGQLHFPLIDGVPTDSPAPPGQAVYDTVDRQVFVSDGSAWQVYDSGEDVPPLITVNQAVPANNSTIFNKIQDAIDSLRNRRIGDTIIKVEPGLYPENLFYMARLSGSSPTSKIATLFLQGDDRDIVGCGIAFDKPWNRQSPPGPVGGGPASRATLSGTTGGNTLTVTAKVLPNPGTVSSIGTTVTGVGTAFTPDMVGGIFTFATAQTARITAVASATSVTVSLAPAPAIPLGTTYTLVQGVDPNFVAAGVIVGDRVAIRHNQGTVPQFSIYTISGVAPTVLTLASPLLGNVNALTAAMVIVPNVEIAPPTGRLLEVRGSLRVGGFFFNSSPGSNSNIINGQWDGKLAFGNNLVYGGTGFGITMNSGAFFRSDLIPYGFTVFNTGDRAIDCFGAALIRAENALLCPREPLAAAVVSIGFLTLVNTNIIGGGSASGLIAADLGSVIEFGGNHITCTSQVAIAIFQSSGNVSLGAPEVRIRGFATGGPLLALGVLAGSRFNANNKTVTLDCANAGPSFIGLQIGSTLTTSNSAQASAEMNLNLLGIPAGSLIASVLDGSSLAIINSTTAPGAVGANSNGFLVRTGSKLVWGGSGANGGIAGGGGMGTLFNIEQCSDFIMRAVAANRAFTGYGTMFNFDQNSRGYISNALLTTSGAGENTNIISRNRSRVVVDTATFNPSGGNIGIRLINGGEVIRQTGTVLTNLASIPVVSPTVGSNTGDIATTIIVPGSTDLFGGVAVLTVTGGAPGGFTVTFSTPYVSVPIVTPSAGAIVTSTSTTAFTVSFVTPPSPDVVFTVNYTVDPGLL